MSKRQRYLNDIDVRLIILSGKELLCKGTKLSEKISNLIANWNTYRKMQKKELERITGIVRSVKSEIFYKDIKGWVDSVKKLDAQADEDIIKTSQAFDRVDAVIALAEKVKEQMARAEKEGKDLEKIIEEDMKKEEAQKEKIKGKEGK